MFWIHADNKILSISSLDFNYSVDIPSKCMKWLILWLSLGNSVFQIIMLEREGVVVESVLIFNYFLRFATNTFFQSLRGRTFGNVEEIESEGYIQEQKVIIVVIPHLRI